MRLHQQQQKIHDFLSALGISDPDRVINDLSVYLKLLSGYNVLVNLVSRKTAPDDYWLYHFLDSMLALKCVDFRTKMVLDFGSGGGLPGIPIRLAVPSVRMFLLEATRKKCVVLRQMLDVLDLKDCRIVNERLENYAFKTDTPRFDYIVSRAVALEPRYYLPLWQLLSNNGRVIMYKSHRITDVEPLRHQVLLEEEVPALGYRQIIAIERNDLIGKLS